MLAPFLLRTRAPKKAPQKGFLQTAFTLGAHALVIGSFPNLVVSLETLAGTVNAWTQARGFKTLVCCIIIKTALAHTKSTRIVAVASQTKPYTRAALLAKQFNWCVTLPLLQLLLPGTAVLRLGCVLMLSAGAC